MLLPTDLELYCRVPHLQHSSQFQDADTKSLLLLLLLCDQDSNSESNCQWLGRASCQLQCGDRRIGNFEESRRPSYNLLQLISKGTGDIDSSCPGCSFACVSEVLGTRKVHIADENRSTSYTATVTSLVTNSVCPTTSPVIVVTKRAAAVVVKRDVKFSGLSVLAASQLSSGCSCLSLTPKATVTSVFTATPSVSYCDSMKLSDDC